ncbi:uncharacterized protein LOC123528437 [Mercenaria mercenaria]|uniref:uncharacterized protein LOC123528437 n=1 Tax=Mercenaria mercenaria TaxID=6596 RepID=UPI00234F0ED0|nr:uncharacterized protein LOC123528437 [Mercenaria mercenaria]
MVKKKKLVLVKWTDNNSETYDGVQQRINKKYIINDNPTFLQKISVRWNRKIWNAIYMEQTVCQPPQKHRAGRKTGRKTEILKIVTPSTLYVLLHRLPVGVASQNSERKRTGTHPNDIFKTRKRKRMSTTEDIPTEKSIDALQREQAEHMKSHTPKSSPLNPVNAACPDTQSCTYKK